ncbi:hypothetical protein SAY87_029868 [Trapa incisa]|uniref:Uncharacterized protein n=1 Tax=Trapa incisa TaxID=236973 RepID=A0AAN7KBS5_9MYRT|nr:hypothetical protein SAY87_029868 [Trapa incisa]
MRKPEYLEGDEEEILRVGADERVEEKSDADLVLGDLVVNLRWKSLPQPDHDLSAGMATGGFTTASPPKSRKPTT